MADKKPEILGATAFKPVERHGWEAIKYFIHNPETGEYFTRTPKSWLLIFIFYVIYYSCLAAFWAGMLAIFLTTIPEATTGNGPRWQHESSLIGVSPGLGLQPKQSKVNIDSSMIQFNFESATDDGEIQGFEGWVNRYKEFTQAYDSQSGSACSEGDGSSASKVCKFDTSSLGPCGKENFGYDSGSPCILLKLNKIYGLTPEAIDDVNGSEMSDELKEHVNAEPNKNQVWVECYGENPADKEVLAGKIKYYPASQGFPFYYFPYMNQDGYVSPLVAVQFVGVPANQLLHIECRAFANNIDYNRRDRIGINHLELHVLNNNGAEDIRKA